MCRAELEIDVSRVMCICLLYLNQLLDKIDIREKLFLLFHSYMSKLIN